MLFRKFADPQTQSLAIPPLRFLVTNTNVPGRSTMRMVDAVGTLVGGPLGKSVGEPLLDAMGASCCMAFAPLGPFSPSLARFAGLLAEQAAGLLGAATITPDSESQLAVRAPTTPHPAACSLGNRVR